MSTNYHYCIQGNCLIVTEPSAPGRSPDSYFTKFAQKKTSFTECTVWRRRSPKAEKRGNRVDNKTDYEVLSGDISFDSDVIRAIAKGQEKDPPQLLEKLNRGFETLRSTLRS
jgi:hypothetical protein